MQNKVKWWQFWNPQSGYGGGLILGIIIVIVVEIINDVTLYMVVNHGSLKH